MIGATETHHRDFTVLFAGLVMRTAVVSMAGAALLLAGMLLF